MADNRTMAQMLQAPIEGYEDAIVVPPINANNFELKQPLINLVQSNKFTGLAIIESKSKVRYSRSRANDSRVSTDAPLSNSSSSNNSFDMQQIAASLEDKMTIKMNQMMNQMKALVVTTPAPVKAVEEVCVTCGSNHNFNHCPLTRGGNDFPVFQDNIQQFQQTAAVGNFLQRNQPFNLASQMRPPGFNQPNVQTNQNRYQGNNPNFNQNRGGNFNQNRQNNQNQVYQAPPYQTPTNQPPINQVLPYQPPTNSVLKTDFENYVKANDAVLKNVQNQGQNLQNQMANVTSLLTSLCDNFKNSASTSNSGTLPSQTVTNPRQQINAITTRSGKILEEPSIPLVPTPDVSKPQKEPEQNPETSTEKVQNPNLENTAHVPSPGEEDSIFMEIPKPKAKKTVNLDPNPNSAVLLIHSDVPSPSSSPDLHEENFQEDVEIKNSNVSDKLVFLNTPLSDKDECFAPEDDNDEIDDFYGYVKYYKKTVKNGQRRTRERMSDQEAKEIKAEARKIMPQPSSVNCS
ncbi:hypothetical protein Tco_0386817 [Tanacetum coccineum]